MNNFEEKNYPQLKIGEKFGFSCLTAYDGTHYISSCTYEVESDDIVGETIQVASSGRRKLFLTFDHRIVLHEIQIGDDIKRFKRFEDGTLYKSVNRICDIYNDVAVTYCIDEVIYPRVE